MVEQRLAMALTTYQVGGLIFLGINPERELNMYAAGFDRAMGLRTDGQTVWLATAMALWRMENCLAEGKAKDGFDRVFVPRISYTTGDLDIHDLVIESNGQPVFVNTRFGCLATTDERYNFAPPWKPPFLSGLVPEDRCHLNGLATGAVSHWLRIEGRIEERFDVAVLPGVVRPKAMSFATPAIGHHFCYAAGNRVQFRGRR